MALHSVRQARPDQAEAEQGGCWSALPWQCPHFFLNVLTQAEGCSDPRHYVEIKVVMEREGLQHLLFHTQ